MCVCVCVCVFLSVLCADHVCVCVCVFVCACMHVCRYGFVHMCVGGSAGVKESLCT